MTYDNYRHWIMQRIKAVAIPADNGCIEYREGLLQHKYGLVSITIDGKRKSVPAHRAMYMASNDCLDLPSDIYIRHKCDNPPCVNLEHLEKGTPTENNQDCVQRKRRAKKYKPHTRIKKLTDEQIKSIREEKGKIWHIAEKYSITSGYVSKIRNGKAKALV